MASYKELFRVPGLARLSLAKALVFICGADHPTTVALKTAAESGSARDIKAARAAFLKLKSGERKAALAMLGD